MRLPHISLDLLPRPEPTNLSPTGCVICVSTLRGRGQVRLPRSWRRQGPGHDTCVTRVGSPSVGRSSVSLMAGDRWSRPLSESSSAAAHHVVGSVATGDGSGRRPRRCWGRPDGGRHFAPPQVGHRVGHRSGAESGTSSGRRQQWRTGGDLRSGTGSQSRDLIRLDSGPGTVAEQSQRERERRSDREAASAESQSRWIGARKDQ